MIGPEELITIEEGAIAKRAQDLSGEEIRFLVLLLNEKDDKIRYAALRLLKCRSLQNSDVYIYKDVFAEKLASADSYQRNIGVILAAANARWDNEGYIEKITDSYFKLLYDEKPITVRYCIQCLESIVPYKPNLRDVIAEKLMSADILSYRETMRRLILCDIINILIMILKYNDSKSIRDYVLNALSGGILDKKSVKEIRNKAGI
jgi:hypothetical protein